MVVTPNVDQIVHRERGTSTASVRLADQAAWVLPDGQPIVWASRILRRPLTARLTGSDLVPALWSRLVENGSPTFVVASSHDTADRVRSDSPAAHAVVAPRLSTDRPDEIQHFATTCAAVVTSHRPTHVFVTLSYPKPDLLISAMIDRLVDEGAPLPLFLAVGQSFEMHYGTVRRAPNWMQRTGMEWFFRFLQEPRRLFRRYFVTDPAFLGIVWRERSRA